MIFESLFVVTADKAKLTHTFFYDLQNLYEQNVIFSSCENSMVSIENSEFYILWWPSAAIEKIFHSSFYL